MKIEIEYVPKIGNSILIGTENNWHRGPWVKNLKYGIVGLLFYSLLTNRNLIDCVENYFENN